MNPAWLANALRRLDEPPDAVRVTLRLGDPGDADVAVIGSIEPWLASRMVDADLPVRAAAGGWCIEAPVGGVDAALASIARWLRDEGLAGAWRDELLAVTDETGRRHAAIERAAVRPLGIATTAVHLVVCNGAGDVWVQKRAVTKATDPGLWDTTVGGLVAADESITQALERETWEEAGLRIDALHGLAPFGRITVRRPVPRGHMVEHIALFVAVLAASSHAPENQDGEVECFECLSRDALIERLQADAFTLEAGVILARWVQRSDGQSPPSSNA